MELDPNAALIIFAWIKETKLQVIPHIASRENPSFTFGLPFGLPKITYL